MEFKDYYHTLGVDRRADQKSVSAAYRKLARRYHPDINKTKGAEEKFKEINEAYQVLGDAEKRARYDQMYEAYQRGGMDWQQIFGGSPSRQAPGGWTVVQGSPEDLEEMLGGLGGFSDFFQQFFGGVPGGSRRGRAAVRDPFARTASPRAEAAATIDVTLTEAFQGAQRPLTLQVNGTTRRLDVTIPKGVRDGQRIRLAGALDGGDLFLTVHVTPDPRFERRDDDLIVDVPVAWTGALLGATIEVPTLEGKVEMKIPPETQNGQMFRLRGQGMPRRTGTRGDQFVRVKVILPTKLSKRERELIEELAKLRKDPGS